MSKISINIIIAFIFSFFAYILPLGAYAAVQAICDNTWREVPNDIYPAGQKFDSGYTMVSKYYSAVSGVYPNHISLVAINDVSLFSFPGNIVEQRCEGGSALTPCSWLDNWDNKSGLVGSGGPRWRWHSTFNLWEPLGMGSADSLYLGTYGGIKTIWATTWGGTWGGVTNIVRKTANNNTWYWDTGSFPWNTPNATSLGASDSYGRSFFARILYVSGDYVTQYRCTGGPATGTISSSPASVLNGNSSTISWSTSGVSSCGIYKYATVFGSLSALGLISNGPTNSSASSGPLNYSYTPYAFRLYCDSGALDQYVYVPVTLPPPPTADIKINGGDTNVSIVSGGSANVSWSSTNSSSCSVTCTSGTCSGVSWQGTSNIGQSTGVLTTNNTYTLTCTSSSGVVATDSLSVNMIPASVSISANPATINQGESSNITWSYSNATAGSCSITPPGSASTYPVGSGGPVSTGILNTSQTYSISCQPSGSGSSSNTTVTVLVPLSLNVEKRGQGTITSSPGGISCGSTCSTSLTLNTSVTLTAAPSQGRRFVGWTVVGGGTCPGVGDCNLTMNSAKTVTANFVVDPNYGEF